LFNGLGANFIHGTEGNPLAEIAKKVGSTFVERTAFGGFFDKAGNALSESDVAFVYEKVFTYARMASEYSREEQVDKDVSVKDFCMEQLEKDKEVKGDRIKGFIASGLELLQGIAACDIDKLSLKYYWMEDDLPVLLEVGRSDI
jgi:hypothetical protein